MTGMPVTNAERTTAGTGIAADIIFKENGLFFSLWYGKIEKTMYITQFPFSDLLKQI